MCREIKEGAVFVADAHQNENREHFYDFLLFLEKRGFNQLFLMGDIFDLLVGEVEYTVRFYEKEIRLLNELSLKGEIFYLEGNHDFNLSYLFPNIKVFPISAQPALFYYGNQKIALSHGDVYTENSYQAYTFIIRNAFLLALLNGLDNFLNNFISKTILKNQERKRDICDKVKNLRRKIEKRIVNYEKFSPFLVLEGHYHQGEGLDFGNIKYFNFDSFGCGRNYYVLDNGKFVSKKFEK